MAVVKSKSEVGVIAVLVVIVVIVFVVVFAVVSSITDFWLSVRKHSRQASGEEFDDRH